MRAAFTLMLALVLLLSHGTMGQAEQHPHDVGHAAAAAADHDAHPVAHDADKPAEPEKGVGQSAHVHVVGDVIRADMPALAVAVALRSPIPVGHSPALASRGVAPLLEPPSA